MLILSFLISPSRGKRGWDIKSGEERGQDCSSHLRECVEKTTLSSYFLFSFFSITKELTGNARLPPLFLFVLDHSWFEWSRNADHQTCSFQHFVFVCLFSSSSPSSSLFSLRDVACPLLSVDMFVCLFLLHHRPWECRATRRSSRWLAMTTAIFSSQHSRNVKKLASIQQRKHWILWERKWDKQNCTLVVVSSPRFRRRDRRDFEEGREDGNGDNTKARRTACIAEQEGPGFFGEHQEIQTKLSYFYFYFLFLFFWFSRPWLSAPSPPSSSSSSSSYSSSTSSSSSSSSTSSSSSSSSTSSSSSSSSSDSSSYSSSSSSSSYYNRRTKADEARDHLVTTILSHIPVSQYNFSSKTAYLAMMVRKMLMAQLDKSFLDDRDYYGNKRIEL